MTRAVTVLGTGLMGAGMARNVAAAGLEVTVWNRTAERARPLAEDGATVATDPAEAIANADVIVTMLFDTDAVIEVMQRALPHAKPGAVWLQCATVGLDGNARLAELAAEHAVGFVDAPVLGTKKPAEEGTLILLASGSPAVREACTPVLDAVGARTIWVSETPGDGQRLKLVANSWVLSVVGAAAQAVGLARTQGLDPRQFLDAISGGPLDCGYVQLKAAAMTDGEFAPSFTLDGALKDSALIAEAIAASGGDGRLMEALQAQFSAAADAGHGEADMVAVIRAVEPGER